MKKMPKSGSKTSKKTKSHSSQNQSCPSGLVAEKCRDLFDHTHDLIQIFRPDGTFLEVNPAWKKFLEYTDKDIQNLSVLNIIHESNQTECLQIFQSVFREQKPQKLSAMLLSKYRKNILVEGQVDCVMKNGKPVALRGIFHDVTKNKQYEDLKDEFISTVSHELRTPLTVVREGAAQMLDGLLGEMTPQQKTMLTMVLQNVDRLSRIIQGLLDASKLEAGEVQLKRTLCNLIEVVQEVMGNFKSIAEHKGLELKTTFDKERIDIYIDRDKIVQVLTNLVNNALKFTKQGYVEVSIHEFEDFVECKVKDTGKGISQEDLPKMFEKFRQFSRDVGPGEKGTGLGLAICKKLIELHHGRVSIDSFPLKGTAITFLLPKYTRRELFKEYIAQTMSKCLEEGSPLSIIVFDIVDFGSLKQKLGIEQADELVAKMEQVINQALRRVADIAMKDSKAVLVLLPNTKKENAYIVLGRLYQVLEEYFKQRQEAGDKIDVHSSVACFPEDADTLEKVLDKIYD